MKATRPEGSSLGSELIALLRVVRAVSPRGAAAQSVAVLLLGLTDGVGLLLLVPVVAALDPTGSVVAQKIPVLSWVGLGRVSLGTALLALVGAVAVRSAMARWSSVARTSLQLRLIDTLRSECLDAVLHARWEFVLTRRRSDIVDTVTTGANRVGGAFDQCVSLAVGVVVAAVTAVVAVIISPVVAGVSVVVGLGAALVMVPVIRSARALGRELGPRSRRAMAATTDALDALRLVRAHDAVTPWEGQVAAGFADLRVAQIRHARAAATNNAITSVLLMSGSAGFVLVAHRADLATGTLVVLLMVLSRMVRRILGVAQLLPSLGTSLAALGDLEQLRRSAQAAVEHTGDALAALPVPTAHLPLVALRGVTYRYPDGTTALVDLDLEIPLGEVTVLVGPSGAGKSTVVDLVLGLLRPTAGEVRVRGLVLDPEVLAAWRTLVGYVPQDTALLPGTLRDNLTWSAGRAEPDDEACWVALDEAAAHFARRLPKGLDTPLGDRGVRLSGGERQRVALARALVRRPELLILDEATSALDLDTEAEVLAVVRALCPTRTVLLVTHRIGSIAATDRVVPIAAVTPSGRTRQA